MTMCKRLVSLLLALLITASLCVFLPACHTETPGNTSSGEQTTEETVTFAPWKLARVPDVADKGETVSNRDYGTNDKWIDATVPGTVLTSYWKAGLIEDPYFSDNMKQLSQDYYNVDYWYRTSFTLPESSKGKRVWLNFDGINWKAHVYVNGQAVGDINGAFIRGNFDITEFVKVGQENTLAVYIVWCNTDVEDMPSFLCSASWDWMPAIPGRNMGIYKPVSVSFTEDVTVDDPFVTTDLPLPDTSFAKVDVSATLTNHSKKDVTGVLSGTVARDDGSGKTYTFEQQLTVKGGETTDVRFDSLTVENPDLWWTNGLGEQPLYALTLSFAKNGTVSDRETVPFGIRELAYDYTKDGGDLTVSVNGVPILCKGGNWGIPDAMLRYTDEDFEDAIRMHADQNFNMIRTWHGTSDFDAFYAACDRYGILVFEDFWLNGWSKPNDIDMFMENVVDKVKRLRNHACMAVWCGENEATPPAPLNKRIPEAVNTYDGTRLYIDASNKGPVAGGVTYALQDPAWYFKHTVGFTTEIGTPCVPTVESMMQMMKEDELWPVGNGVWQYHDWDFDIGNKVLESYEKAITSRYGTGRNIYEFCETAQLVNYETYKAMFEAWNDNLLTETSGILLWMSHPAWPSTIWQTYDYYKEGTGGYYGSRLACEPVHVQWNCLTGDVKVINNTGDAVSGAKAQVTVYNLDGTVKLDRNFDVTASGAAATLITNLLGSDGGKNLAAGKPATASSSDEKHPPSLAFDGKVDGENRWTAGDKGHQWLCVDIGEVKSIDHVRVEWENAFASSYYVDVSTDGETFQTVKTVNGNADGGIDLLSFEPVNARYVRLNCTSAATMWAYAVYEMEVIETGSMGEPIEGLSDTHFIKLKLTDKDGNLLSENFYWRGVDSCNYTAMAKMKKAKVDASYTRTDKDGVTTLTVTLKNTSDLCAVALRLKVQKSFMYEGETETRVLPVSYEDNFFSLTPHETRTLTVTFDTADLNGAEPTLVVDGYNVGVFAVAAE